MIHPIRKLVESSVLQGVCENFLIVVRAFEVENVAYSKIPIKALGLYNFIRVLSRFLNGRGGAYVRGGGGGRVYKQNK